MVMMLDAARAVVILIVAVSRFPGAVEGLATLPVMNTAGSRRLLDVLAYDHRAHSGTYP